MTDHPEPADTPPTAPTVTLPERSTSSPTYFMIAGRRFTERDASAAEFKLFEDLAIETGVLAAAEASSLDKLVPERPSMREGVLEEHLMRLETRIAECIDAGDREAEALTLADEHDAVSRDLDRIRLERHRAWLTKQRERVAALDALHYQFVYSVTVEQHQESRPFDEWRAAAIKDRAAVEGYVRALGVEHPLSQLAGILTAIAVRLGSSSKPAPTPPASGPTNGDATRPASPS